MGALVKHAESRWVGSGVRVPLCHVEVGPVAEGRRLQLEAHNFGDVGLHVYYILSGEAIVSGVGEVGDPRAHNLFDFAGDQEGGSPEKLQLLDWTLASGEE